MLKTFFYRPYTEPIRYLTEETQKRLKNANEKKKCGNREDTNPLQIGGGGGKI